MSIPFTQYTLPDGRKSKVVIDMPANIEKIAHALIERGCHFDVEMLSTGLISMTCEKDGDLLAIEVCLNNEKVVAGVENIIKQSAIQQRIQWI